MHTVWGAFAAFDEKQIGMLEEDYQADLVIVDRNVSRIPAQDLIDVRFLLPAFGARGSITKQNCLGLPPVRHEPPWCADELCRSYRLLFGHQGIIALTSSITR